MQDEEIKKAIDVITPVAEQAGLSSEEMSALVDCLSTLSEIKPVKVSPEQGKKILAKVKAFDERKEQPDDEELGFLIMKLDGEIDNCNLSKPGSLLITPNNPRKKLYLEIRTLLQSRQVVTREER